MYTVYIIAKDGTCTFIGKDFTTEAEAVECVHVLETLNVPNVGYTYWNR